MYACMHAYAWLHICTYSQICTCVHAEIFFRIQLHINHEAVKWQLNMHNFQLPAFLHVFLNSQCFAVFVGKGEARGSGSRRNGVWAELNAWSTTAAGFVILHAVSMIGHQWNEPGSAWLPDASSCWYVFDFFLLQSFSGMDMIFIQKTGCQERAPGLNPEPAGLH